MDGLGNQEVSRKKGENHENRLPALRWEVSERESDREREQGGGGKGLFWRRNKEWLRQEARVVSPE